MTTQKDVSSVEDALQRAGKAFGGLTNLARVMDMQPYRLAHAANPNKPDGVRFDEALSIDRLCKERGAGTPLMDWYSAQLADADGPDLHPAEHLARLIEIAGPVKASLARALHDGRVSETERRDVLRGLSELAGVISAAMADLVAADDQGAAS